MGMRTPAICDYCFFWSSRIIFAHPTSPPVLGQNLFALCTPHQTEAHYSMYLSLFGCDLKAGQTARARARLLIAEKLSCTDAVKAYESYLQELGGK